MKYYIIFSLGTDCVHIVHVNMYSVWLLCPLIVHLTCPLRYTLEMGINFKNESKIHSKMAD